MEQKELSTNIYTFEKLIKFNNLYVDKTEYIWRMISPFGKQFFLSRPRRFGKSLTISTIKAIFQGKRELFNGLAISRKSYDWGQYPVIHLDFNGRRCYNADQLEECLCGMIREQADALGMEIQNSNSPEMFRKLIDYAYKQNSVVILVDEYDKPILSNVINPHVKDMLRILKDFYSVIKALEGKQRFALITGVSKFCHVSVFSELNNLTDITLRNEYDAMLGFTKEEILEYFGDRLEQIAEVQAIDKDVLLNHILDWYDGYRFSKTNRRVCNPVSITSFFDNNGDFQNYWHDTGTPSFLLELARNTSSFDLEAALAKPVASDVFKPYELDNMEPLGLLWQTGYMTIKEVIKDDDGQSLYQLGFPNHEVKQSFLKEMLSYYAGFRDIYTASLIKDIRTSIHANNVPDFMRLLKVCFANIPYSIKVKDEKYFQSLFYQLFLLIGAYIEVECCTNDGRVDAVIKTRTHVYVFEFKLDRGAATAMTQILDKQYYVKYQMTKLPIVIIGVNFDYDAGMITEWKEMPAPER